MKKIAVRNNWSEKVKNVSRGKHGTERVKVPTNTCTLPSAAASISGGQTGVDRIYTPQVEVPKKPSSCRKSEAATLANVLKPPPF